MNNQLLTPTIFDLIEERPKTLTWIKLTKKQPYKQSEVLYDSFLGIFESKDEPELYRCVLTHEGLFKYKV